MLWDVLSDEEKNNVLLKVLVKLSKVDNELHENEFAYLVYVCNKLKIDKELIREFALHEGAINEIIPSTEEERMTILYHLLFMMNADDAISQEEEKAVYEMAFRLGFSEEMVRDFISLMKTYKLSELPDGVMIEIIKKYRN